MTPYLSGLLTGVLGTLAFSIAFLIYAMWHAKRYPLVKPDDFDGTELARTTTIQARSNVIRMVRP